MYKTLGVRWLLECFCPASTFVSADRDEARNPQRFIHVTVMPHPKKTTRQTINEHKSERQNANASAKSKELHPNAQSQRNAAHLLLP